MTADGNVARKIRCTHGHSSGLAIKNEALLTKMSSAPESLVHLTYRSAIKSILERGLLPGGGYKSRAACMFSPFRWGDSRQLAGARKDGEVEIVFSPASTFAQHELFLSGSGAISIFAPVDRQHILEIRDVITDRSTTTQER